MFLNVEMKVPESNMTGDLLSHVCAVYLFCHHLACQPGRVFSRQQIINDIKGTSYPVTERSIDVQILSIRKKLAEAAGNPSAANMIETVRGVGYRFAEELEQDGQ